MWRVPAVGGVGAEGLQSPGTRGGERSHLARGTPAPQGCLPVACCSRACSERVQPAKVLPSHPGPVAEPACIVPTSMRCSRCTFAGRGAWPPQHCPVPALGRQPGAAARHARVSGPACTPRPACSCTPGRPALECLPALRMLKPTVRRLLHRSVVTPAWVHKRMNSRPPTVLPAPVHATMLHPTCCRDYLAFRNVSVFKQGGGAGVPLSVLLG